MAAAQYFEQVQKIFIAFYQRPADPAGLKYWAQRVDAAGGDISAVIDAFAASPEAQALYGTIDADTIGGVIDDLYMALFNVEPDAAGKQFYVDGFVAGDFTAGTIALAVLNGARNDDLIAINNKVQVANEFTQQADGRLLTDANFGFGSGFNVTYEGDADAIAARAILKGVTSQTSTVLNTAQVTDLLKAQIADVNDPINGQAGGAALTLTDGIDNIVGNAADNVISAPVVQNQEGRLVNSLETGDRVDGGAGFDTLNAVLTNSQGATDIAPAISATISNVEVVNYRAQFINTDGIVNGSNVDAELHSGVQQYWSDNSRSDLQIEDVRQLPEVLTFGMRQTDVGSDFSVYFDPAQLAEDRGTAGDSSLTLTLVDNSVGANELANFPVNGVVFTLDGTQYNVGTDAALGATYAEFVANLQTALQANPALADVTVTLNANNSITLTDPAGATFGAVGYTWVGNVVPAGGELQWNQAVGAAVVSDAPVTTSVVLDAVGRTGQGGNLEIGSMAAGGVEVFNVAVDRSSWLTSMSSSENFGVGDGHLETVNLTSIGANGNLTVGDRVANRLDNRVEDGLTDVREVNGAAFAGQLNLGVTLTGDAIGRYLDGASEPVDFTYTASAQNDIFNIAVNAGVSNDPDFRMDVNMGAGDDRLIFGGADNLNNISVDGGTGNNTFVTSTNIGTGATPAAIANHEFASFTNFQNLEIEGAGADVDFTTLGGVTSVVVATNAGADTTLIDLAANNGIVLTGKNQTIGNNSNADQEFGDIDVLGADGAALTVTLQNTARIDGELSVDLLNVADQNAGNQSAVRTLNVVSAGARQTTNVVESITAERVGTINLSGTQDLGAYIAAAANTAGAAAGITNLVVNGSALTGQLDLGIDAAIVTAVDAQGKTNTLTGTAGTTDRLTFDGAITATANTIVSGFETVRFVDGSGDFDASGVTGVTLYDINELTGALDLNHLRSVETVQINTDAAGTVAGNELTFATEAASSSSSLTLNFRDADALVGVNNTAFAGAKTNLEGFTTVNLDLGGTAAAADAYTFDFGFQDSEGLVKADPTFDFAKVAAKTLVLTGGQATAANLGDSVDLGLLTSTLTLIDLSGYKGTVTAELDNPYVAGNSTSAPTAISGNTLVKVNGFELNFTDADHVDATITTFQFTTDAVNDTQDWTIGDFQGFNAAGGSLSNLSILDLSALGVDGLVDIIITDDGTDATITSNEGLNFEIVLTGVLAAELSNENFKFAA